MHLKAGQLTVFVLLCSLGMVAKAGLWGDAFRYTGNDPDRDRTLIDVIKSKGYPAQEYEVQTDDGYLLSATRIAHGRHQEPSTGKPVALLLHGIYASTGTWVANLPDQSLGYILADEGYDVWMGCLRGCPLSRKHVNVTENSKQFWDFSWEEIGVHDLPAFVDYILKATGKDKLSIVAHSMGTTASFTFLSLKPEYNSKVNALVAMAPIANIAQCHGMMKFLLPFGELFNGFVNSYSYGEVTFSPSIRRFMEIMCGMPLIKIMACDVSYMMGDGMEDPSNFNQTRLPVYIQHVLGAASTKELNHFSQVGLHNRFARYDYGTTENKKRYGQSSPPLIPVEKITAPVALFSSKEDLLGDPSDVAKLRASLRNIVADHVPALRPWTHMDFVLGVKAKSNVYDDVLKVLKRF